MFWYLYLVTMSTAPLLIIGVFSVQWKYNKSIASLGRYHWFPLQWKQIAKSGLLWHLINDKPPNNAYAWKVLETPVAPVSLKQSGRTSFSLAGVTTRCNTLSLLFNFMPIIICTKQQRKSGQELCFLICFCTVPCSVKLLISNYD